MKIKTQLRLFLAGVILVPVLAVAGLSAYHYTSHPDRLLLDGYKEIRNMDGLNLSNKDIFIMKQVMNMIPSDIEFMMVSHLSKILLTSIPDFAAGEEIDKGIIFDYVNRTSSKYFYQIVSPPLEDKDAKIMLICRIPRDRKEKSGFEKLVNFIIFLVAFFEIFCITFIAIVSKTITKSITLLDKNTQRIASGELDVKLEYEKNSKNDNEITRLTENLNKMRLALKDDAERRSKFIMGISHDLRTPVAIIKGYTEAVQDGIYENPEEVKKSLEIIGTKTDQLETMINTLINFVKLNRTDWIQSLKKQKIKPVINDFAESSKTTGEIFKRKVTTEIKIDENLEVSFDRLLFQRSLENLFSNAIRYTNENDLIAFTAIQGENFLKLTIKDSGIGIAKENLNKIFDLFYRASSSRREEGMGIGLSVVKTIVNAHGWDISVESEQGKGAAFIITIPFQN